ncbi:MAG: DivIVA domain-containing protein [Sporichthyaceae bacterium]
MFVLMVLLVAVVVFGVAAVAAGAGGTLADAALDRAPWRAPEEPLAAADLETVRFPSAIRGYRMDLVDAVLDRAAAALAARDAEILALRAEVRAARAGEGY